mgnify:CR=1 FL=1
MRYPLYVIFNDDWSFNRYEYGVNFTAVTGRPFSDATKHSVATLLEHYAKPITQTQKPPSAWLDVASQPDVLIEGEGAAQTAKLTWPTAPISLEAAKVKLKERAKDCKFARMDGGVEFDLNGETKIAQTDGESRSLLMASYFKALSGGLPNGRKWRFLDNSYPLLTTEQVIALGDAVDAMVSACYDQQDAHGAAINLLPDLADCKAYNCEAGYPALPTTPTE